jgi:hypothetical protein
VESWLIVYVVVLLLIVTPLFYRRGDSSQGLGLVFRRKTPWVIGGVLVLTFIVAPLSFAAVISAQHPRDEATFLRYVNQRPVECRDFPNHCTVARVDAPVSKAARKDPQQFISAGDKALCLARG